MTEDKYSSFLYLILLIVLHFFPSPFLPKYLFLSFFLSLSLSISLSLYIYIYIYSLCVSAIHTLNNYSVDSS